jgi:hypothetical protein
LKASSSRGTIRAVEFARADDRSVVIVVEPSGGRPDFARIALTSPYSAVVGGRGDVPIGAHPDAATLVTAAIYYRGFATMAAGSAIAHWLAYRIVFRGGWTVHVDAPDRDPLKIRCGDRAAAEARAREIAENVASYGEAAIDTLRPPR